MLKLVLINFSIICLISLMFQLVHGYGYALILSKLFSPLIALKHALK
jgi:hypothetical protein